MSGFYCGSMLICVSLPALAQNLPRYDIYRTPAPITIDGKLDEPAWRQAPAVGDFHFNWWKEGTKEPTVAKLLWDDDNLYVSFYCHDKNISADVVKRHGPVSRDDSVEAFISPNTEKIRNYYGFEINVIGTMLNFIRADWYKGSFNTEPEGVRYRTSFHGLPVKNDSPDDDHWILELAIPFSNFAKDAPHTPPRDGDTWRLNLNRAGGKTNPQYSTWSPVSTERPNFHVPEAFGWVRFVNRPSASAPAAQNATPFTEKLYPVFEKSQCRLCHNDNGVASGTRLRFPGEKASAAEIEQFGLRLRAFVNPKRLEDSLLLQKPTNRIPHTGGERIRPGSDEEKILQSWATYLSRLDAAPTVASTSQAAGPQISRRLTHSQYNNTVRDLLGDESRPASKFPTEDFVHGFTNQAEGQAMSPLLSEAYNRAAEKLARNAFRGGDAQRLIPCKPAGAAHAACRDRFVREFGRRAFRRPLSADESTRYGRLFAMEARRSSDFLKGAQVVVEAMLQSPNFLFHQEPGADRNQRAYAIANRLSYFLWDTMPDEALLQAAEKGQLNTTAKVRAQIERLLAHQQAKSSMEEFLAQWLRYDRLRTAFREVRLYPEFSSELVSSMLEETRRLFDHLVWGDRNFLEFFTADYGFLNADLAQLYEFPAPPAPFARVAFPADSKRAGVLGQATFLSVTGKPADSSPTERGLFVREHFLCQIVPPPPPGVNTTLPPLTDEKPLNNRKRLDAHLANPACAGCHRLIDPIGFGFENFDAIGKFRDKHLIRIYPTFDEMKNRTKTRPTEHKLDIDPSGFIQGMPNSQFTSPKEAGRVLAGDPGCQKCIVKMLFRYALGRPETEADQTAIEAALGDFRSSQFRFKNLIIAIATSEPFLGGPD